MTQRSGNRFQLSDLLDLGLLMFAKARRRKLGRAGQDQSTFYEDFFTDTDEAVRWRGHDPRRALVHQVLKRAAAPYAEKGALLVDVGCGLGDNLLAVGEEWQLVGVEYSASSAQVARRRLHGHARVLIGSASALPFKDEEARVALCLEVLEHLEDDSRALREIHRVLAPDGMLIASVPYRYWFPQYLPLMGHFRHYTRTTFVALLERNGFRVVRYLPNYPEWNRKMNYAYVSCRAASIAARLVGRRASPLEVRFPGCTNPLMEQLRGRLTPILEREEQLKYASLETSTSVVARKV